MSKRSAELFKQAQEVLAGGVSRNTLLRSPHPIYVERGDGCRVTDVEGVERIDFANNMASLIHGHNYAPMVEAVTEQLKRGTAFTLATEVEIEFARLLTARSPNFDKIRFMNSGTEAVMAGLKAARAFTGRPRFAKVEGTYHGAYDYAEVSQAPAPHAWGEPQRPASVALAMGTPPSIVEDVIVIPFNDPEAAARILDEHKDEIACVLIDPIPHRAGLVPAEPAFVEAISAWTQANGALLVFDEVITFRSEVGGMQSRYSVAPDLTAMGKIIGGGFPVGAIAGRDDVMSVFLPGPDGPRLPQSGTFSANPITMTAGLVAMKNFEADEVRRLNQLGQLARDRIEEAISVADVPASVTGTGSMFRIHLKAERPKDYRSAFLQPGEKPVLDRFLDALSDSGVMLIYSAAGMLSTPMGESEIDQLVEAVLAGLCKVKDGFPS